jgi:peptidoglycan/xylan/chitin deacetylase (PgdA/CDA1 family)
MNKIKDQIKKVLRRGLTSFGSVKNPTDPFVRVLMYHDIERDPSHAFSVSIESFEEQMKYLKDSYKLVSVKDAQSFINGSSHLKENAIAITFDDGLRNVFANGYPVLTRLKIPATVFLISNFVESGEDVSTGREYLRLADIREMREEIITYGSHTRNHKMLSKLTEEQIKENIEGSKIDLEQLLGHEIPYFAYPYGLKRHFDQRAINIARDSGYKCAFSAINGVNFQGCDLYTLRRSKVERDDSFATFKGILAGRLDKLSILDSL